MEHVHPVVRRHPVTGEEALYVNKQFTRRIVGLKKEESGQYRVYPPLFVLMSNQCFDALTEAILNFLYEHIAKAGDLQARVRWTPNTVVLWDNRITAHVRI